MAEFALVFPVLVLVLFSIIVLALYVFYNQQLENAAREAARYAALHSSTAQCPTVSRLDPAGANKFDSYFRCDAPESGSWPRMTTAARTVIWGMPSSAVSLSACWSGFVDPSNNPDALPDDPDAVFTPCTIQGVDPRSSPDSLACPAPLTRPPLTPGKADGDDTASNLAYGSGRHFPTTVTVYACFTWNPPLSGFLFVPSSITLRAVVTEVLQRQQ